MRMVNDRRCASIKSFKATAKLAPEDIGGLVIGRLKVACNFLVAYPTKEMPSLPVGIYSIKL